MIAHMQAAAVGLERVYVIGFKPILMLVILALVYNLPTMLAFKRGIRRRWTVLAINLMLGWTVIGWIVAMVMTYAYEPPAEGEGPDREHVPGTPRG